MFGKDIHAHGSSHVCQSRVFLCEFLFESELFRMHWLTSQPTSSSGEKLHYIICCPFLRVQNIL